MLDLKHSAEKVRHSMSLPNILFSVEDEEIEELIERPITTENNGTCTKRWYKKLRKAGRFLMDSMKRKDGYYEVQHQKDINGNNDSDKCLKISQSAIEESPVDSSATEKIPLDSKYKWFLHYSVADDKGSSQRPWSFHEQYSEACAVAQRRLKISDIFCGRYRKF